MAHGEDTADTAVAHGEDAADTAVAHGEDTADTAVAHGEDTADTTEFVEVGRGTLGRPNCDRAAGTGMAQGQNKTSDATQWLDRHGDSLFRYALLQVRDKALAEDLVQETLLAALRARERFAGQASERTWLIGILRHKIIDHVRLCARRRPLDLDLDVPAEEAFDARGLWKQGPRRWQVDQQSTVESQEFWGMLHQCIDRLPATARQAFCLRDLEGLGTTEICEILSISATNLGTLLHRARSALRRCLEQRWFGP